MALHKSITLKTTSRSLTMFTRYIVPKTCVYTYNQHIHINTILITPSPLQPQFYRAATHCTQESAFHMLTGFQFFLCSSVCCEYPTAHAPLRWLAVTLRSGRRRRCRELFMCVCSCAHSAHSPWWCDDAPSTHCNCVPYTHTNTREYITVCCVILCSECAMHAR